MARLRTRIAVGIGAGIGALVYPFWELRMWVWRTYFRDSYLAHLRALKERADLTSAMLDELTEGAPDDESVADMLDRLAQDESWPTRAAAVRRRFESDCG